MPDAVQVAAESCRALLQQRRAFDQHAHMNTLIRPPCCSTVGPQQHQTPPDQPLNQTRPKKSSQPQKNKKNGRRWLLSQSIRSPTQNSCQHSTAWPSPLATLHVNLPFKGSGSQLFVTDNKPRDHHTSSNPAHSPVPLVACTTTISDAECAFASRSTPLPPPMWPAKPHSSQPASKLGSTAESNCAAPAPAFLYCRCRD